MNDQDKARIIAAYNERLDRLGETPAALGWARGRHNVRFSIFAEQLNFDGASVLDFGCGMADFLGFLRDRGCDVSYVGVDINERLVQIAQERYPDARFLTRDMLSDSVDFRVDYAVASGVHNVKMADNTAFLRASLDALWAVADKAVALNFLSNKVSYPTQHSHHSDPAEVLSICYEKTNKLVLRNDYMPFEFTVVLFKDGAFDPEKVVYPEYAELV